MINLLHLALLTLLNEARVAHIDQTLPESHGDRQCATRMSHPYTVDHQIIPIILVVIVPSWF